MINNRSSRRITPTTPRLRRVVGFTEFIATLSRTNVIPATPQPILDGPASAEARRIIDQLRQAGFVAYLAGGCVRDALLELEPKDFDVATDATPDSVRELFGKKRTLAFGASFGVIGVLPARGGQDRNRPVDPTEVATFRSDGDYSDGRRPDSVHFGNAKEDALRRDFTINGLFYDTQAHQVIDYVDGRKDLERQILRTIGDPIDRFREDKLRMLRAVRFATTLGFQVEPATLDAIRQHAGDIEVVSGERIGAEMRRVLVSPNSASGLQRLIDSGLDSAVLPEIAAADVDRYHRLIDQVAVRSFPLALACLLTVVPEADQALSDITARWKLSNEETRTVRAALSHWKVIAKANSLQWSVVQPVLINRDIATIVGLAAAIVAVDGADLRGVAIANQSLELSPQALNPPPLIDGNDLNDIGIKAGPKFKELLQSIRNAQLDKKITTRGQAIAKAKELLS